MRTMPGDATAAAGRQETSSVPASGPASATASAKASASADESSSASASSTSPASASSAESSDNDSAKIAALEANLTGAEKNEILTKAKQTALEYDKTPTTLKYCVAGKGDVGSLTGFENTIFRVLNDPRGWPRAGVVFEQADSGCDFTIVLAAPSEMKTFADGCSDQYSCRVGDDVIINKERWDDGVEAWLAAGGTLSQYRTMVINHEVGHRLGHVDNETTCAGAGQAAPLMQEQSMSLRGCSPNAWPLDDELWTDLAY
ncbi:DUF3152 domain-containing protein [Bifidobacterium sp. BRDM6]|uniref:DUF3152 domain-containing protein n=2 Tax=Bifidobacterium choloepi TaxID=2614131 RepID=A0A6I5NCM6_9BIFI|nr:DUF3152 domain-containing protein [Bifidobacterium choloepi]